MSKHKDYICVAAGCSKFKVVGEDYEYQIYIICSVRNGNEVEGIQC